MNKLLLIISSALLISACTGEPQKQDPDALPNGIMQPVEGTGAVAGGSFMPEIERIRCQSNEINLMLKEE